MSNRIGRSLTITRKVMLTTAAHSHWLRRWLSEPWLRPLYTSPAPATVGQKPQAPKVGDLEAVLEVMRDPAATAADKEGLIGKAYAGVVVVDAVRLGPNGAAVWALPSGSAAGDNAYRIVLAFAARADDEKLQQLRKGQRSTARNPDEVPHGR